MSHVVGAELCQLKAHACIDQVEVRHVRLRRQPLQYEYHQELKKQRKHYTTRIRRDSGPIRFLIE